MSLVASRRGTGYIDVIVTLFLLAAAGVIFAATFPTGFASATQGQEHKIATAIASRKAEQFRALNYQSLGQSLLLAGGLIDSDPSSSPYSFTSVDGVAQQLAQGTGAVYVEDWGSDIKRVRIIVSWKSVKAPATRSVQLTLLFADQRTRAVN